MRIWSRGPKATVNNTKNHEKETHGSIDIESQKCDNVFNESKTLLTPKFREEWKDEFLETSIQPDTVRAVSCIGGIYFLFDFLYDTFGPDSKLHNEKELFLWVFSLNFPHLLCALAYCALLMVLSSSSLKCFSVKNYNFLCACQIVFTYLAVVASRVLLEIKRAKFQRPSYSHIHWNLDFQNFPPTRKCNDTDPVMTFRMMSTNYDDDTTSIGCQNAILAGGMLSTYIFLNMIPVMYHLNPKVAILTCLINDIIIAFGCISTGTLGSTLGTFIALQTVAGLSSAYFCRNNDILAKKRFAVMKATKLASEQYGNLLYTLIPKNVVLKLANHDKKDMLGCSIEYCTVMFCSLEPHEEFTGFSEETFELLNAVFSEFDRTVQRYGMFKYQHVSDWYIVACPRAANPFDDQERGSPYPIQHITSMIFLAEELRNVAMRFKVGEKQLRLKVGINGGSVAGAVIGTHRSFYCLYGDSINTAARMCKIPGDEIHCTAAFQQRVEGACSSIISCTSHGMHTVKGKGAMEVFNISVSPSYLTVATAFSGSVSAEPSHSGQRRRELGGKRSFWRSLLRFDTFMESIMHEVREDVLDWIDNARHRIHQAWVVFKDSDQERLFVDAHAPIMREGVIAGLAVHLCCFACQWNLATHPEYQYDFQALGAPDLAHAQRLVLVTLSIHWVLLSAYCVALLLAMWRFPRHARICHARYALIKLVHMCIAVLTLCELPALWGLMLSFTFEMICLHGAMSTLPFRLTAAMVCASFAVFATSLTVVHGPNPYAVGKAAAYAAASIVLSRLANHKLRHRWRQSRIYDVELERLQSKLSDLLPARVVTSMLEQSARLPCERSPAAVLQLDICGFTAMSQELRPIEVAEMVHSLFCAFDAAVQGSGLFKMDTVGDAYLVAGLLPAFRDESADGGAHLPEDHDEAAAQERARVCADVLAVARSMIEAVEAYRTDSGRAVQCRIGVSVGQVLTGVLGELQPRFHMYGPGMRSAEALEQASVPGAVHVSATFARELQRGMSPTAQRTHEYVLQVRETASTWGCPATPVAAERQCGESACQEGTGHEEWWIGGSELVSYQPECRSFPQRIVQGSFKGLTAHRESDTDNESPVAPSPILQTHISEASADGAAAECVTPHAGIHSDREGASASLLRPSDCCAGEQSVLEGLLAPTAGSTHRVSFALAIPESHDHGIDNATAARRKSSQDPHAQSLDKAAFRRRKSSAIQIQPAEADELWRQLGWRVLQTHTHIGCHCSTLPDPSDPASPGDRRSRRSCNSIALTVASTDSANGPSRPASNTIDRLLSAFRGGRAAAADGAGGGSSRRGSGWSASSWWPGLGASARRISALGGSFRRAIGGAGKAAAASTPGRSAAAASRETPPRADADGVELGTQVQAARDEGRLSSPRTAARAGAEVPGGSVACMGSLAGGFAASSSSCVCAGARAKTCRSYVLLPAVAVRAPPPSPSLECPQGAQGEGAGGAGRQSACEYQEV